jgi:uncharacterized protein YbjT (DUF2867 family)
MELVPKNSERIILVTGATGRQGGTVFQHLQKIRRQFARAGAGSQWQPSTSTDGVWEESVSGRPR